MDLSPIVLPINFNDRQTWPEDWRRAAGDAEHALKCRKVTLACVEYEPRYSAAVAQYKDGTYYTASYPTGEHFAVLRFVDTEEPSKMYRVRLSIGILP